MLTARQSYAGQLAAGAAAFFEGALCGALWVLALWTAAGCFFLWVAASTGEETMAATGRTNTRAAIRRLSEVNTDGSSGIKGQGQAGLTAGASIKP